jgi:hypothetical protein
MGRMLSRFSKDVLRCCESRVRLHQPATSRVGRLGEPVIHRRVTGSSSVWNPRTILRQQICFELIRDQQQRRFTVP